MKILKLAILFASFSLCEIYEDKGFINFAFYFCVV